MVKIENGIIYIDGRKFKAKEKPKPRTNTGRARALLALMGIMETYNLTYPYGTPKHQRVRPKVNIVEEFALIQKKQSRLSKNDRDWVERMFYKNFTEIIEPPCQDS